MTNAEDGAVLRPRTSKDAKAPSLLWAFIKVMLFLTRRGRRRRPQGATIKELSKLYIVIQGRDLVKIARVSHFPNCPLGRTNS